MRSRVVVFRLQVETISSVYMVSSGIPSRNGDRHCIEIARLSVDLMKVTEDYVIPHMPDHQLQLRIGIHTGGCFSRVSLLLFTVSKAVVF